MVAVGGGEPHGYTEFMATVDAVVIGRKTFETVLAFGGWFYGTMPVVVLSSRPSELTAPAGAVCDVMTGTPHEVVARLPLSPDDPSCPPVSPGAIAETLLARPSSRRVRPMLPH